MYSPNKRIQLTSCNIPLLILAFHSSFDEILFKFQSFKNELYFGLLFSLIKWDGSFFIGRGIKKVLLTGNKSIVSGKTILEVNDLWFSVEHSH